MHLALLACHPGRVGGMETFCRFLADTLLAAGWRVTVGLSGENIYGAMQSRYGRRLDVEPLDWLDATCAGDREYARSRILQRRGWFRHIRPDVALFVQSSNTPFRASVVAARLAGVPVVTTHRTMAWPVEQVPSRRHLFGWIPGLGLHGRRVVFKTWLTAALASRVVYNSTAVRSGYEALYRYPRRRGVVIPNAVLAVSSTTPADRSVCGEHPLTIGYVGRLGSDKRLDVLLRAVASMQMRDVRVVVHGEGAEEPQLAELARHLGIADRVAWRGVTQDPPSAYADMDVVVLCSPRESSSNMVLEAMAAGKAVVVGDTGGMPELVERDRCGICVPALDYGALAGTLDRLARDRELCRTLGGWARQKALEEHDPARVGRQWLALLGDVAAMRGADSPPVEEFQPAAV